MSVIQLITVKNLLSNTVLFGGTGNLPVLVGIIKNTIVTAPVYRNYLCNSTILLEMALLAQNIIPRSFF